MTRKLPVIPPEVEIMTEDDKIVRHGDRVYNYYDMKPGAIEIKQSDVEKITSETNIRNDIWFFVNHDDGSRSLLNGARICTIEFAKRRGFKDA